MPLEGFTRVPVCSACLKEPEPLDAEFFCRSCKTPFQNRFPLDSDGVCALCREGLRGFNDAYCFGTYGGTLRGLIHLFKYRGVKPLAGHLARLLRDAAPLDRRFDAVVPIPLHWRKHWERGFNQSELLAKEIGRHRGVPAINALRRRRATSTQAGLSHSARRRNGAGAFAVTTTQAIAGKRILRVDDVMTTGAPASACGAALKAAGAVSVTLLTIARVDRRIAQTPKAGSEAPRTT